MVRKKTIVLVISMVLAVILFSGCSSNTKEDSSASSVTAVSTEPAGSVSKTEAVKFPDIERKPRQIDKKYGIYYEIFVRSFSDSNGDGIGDLKGLTSRLDYLNDNNPKTDSDLGINGIYLMPVNVSPSYHKYDVTDYYQIDPEYGTLDDFNTFISEAHKRGIKVIMDLVINHTSSKNPWFIKSAQSRDNAFREFYTWINEGQEGYNLKGTSSWGGKLWHPLNGSYYYGIFWDQMPDLNYDSTKVREEIKKIEKYWLDKKVDGFRLDAAMHIYGAFENKTGTNYLEKNLKWWKEFGAAAEEVNPDVYLVGEVWDKTSFIAPYYQGLDSLFNFDLAEGIISTVNTGLGSAVSGKGFSSWLSEKYLTYAKTEPNFLDAPFLSNHDQNRVMDRFNGDIAKAKLSAAIYLTLPGNPFIYYGEEIGMKGIKPDERIREPFIWYKEAQKTQCTWEANMSNRDTVPEEVQQKDPNSLLNYYKKLIKVRQSSQALIKGDFKALDVRNKSIVAYSRSVVESGTPKESVIVLHNVSNTEQSAVISDNLSKAEIIFNSNNTGKIKIDGSNFVISPKSTIIIRK